MICNVDTKKYLAAYPLWARDPFTRLRGMLWRRFVCGKFDALVFEHCNSVHTCFMGYPLDLVFIDGERKVVSVCKRVPPWRVICGGRGARAVIELPPGAIEFSGTLPGHTLNLDSTLSREGIEKFSSEAILLSEN
ncbi:MAG: DUF192 domain-containing protein [Lentisphaeria bacterium]|nr:DUF192 domain-containing protein [Lentisphaeria bacterium]